VKLQAKPEPIDVDPGRSVVVVVDMQNAFASKKGMLDIAGADISGAPQVVGVIGQVLSAARRAGMPVAYLQMGYKADLSDSGGPESPNGHKELGIRMMNCRPELKGHARHPWHLGLRDRGRIDAATGRYCDRQDAL
jgi:ureidoacrylate peracid hydrolase